jgi:hypothetical protein
MIYTYRTIDDKLLIEDESGNQNILDNNNGTDTIFLINKKDKPENISWEELSKLLNNIKIIKNNK